MGFTEHYLSGMMQSWGEVLGQHGYEHVKAEELARTVGMSVGTLYRRYGSKQRFAQEVRDFNENTFCQEVDWAFFCKHGADGVTFRQAFFVFWDALTRHALGLPRTFSFTFLHRHPEAPGQKAPGSEARALVREVLLKGVQDGALKPGCARVGEALVWGTLAELVRALAERNEQVYQEDIRDSAEALWRALAKTEDSGGAHGSGGPPDGLAQPESQTSTGDSESAHDGGSSPGVAPREPQPQADVSQEPQGKDLDGPRGGGTLPCFALSQPQSSVAPTHTLTSAVGPPELPPTVSLSANTTPIARCAQRTHRLALRRHVHSRPGAGVSPGWRVDLFPGVRLGRALRGAGRQHHREVHSGVRAYAEAVLDYRAGRREWRLGAPGEGIATSRPASSSSTSSHITASDTTSSGRRGI